MFFKFKKKGENIINICNERKKNIYPYINILYILYKSLDYPCMNTPIRSLKDTKTHTQAHLTCYNFSLMRLKDENGWNHIENKEFE